MYRARALLTVQSQPRSSTRNSESLLLFGRQVVALLLEVVDSAGHVTPNSFGKEFGMPKYVPNDELTTSVCTADCSRLANLCKLRNRVSTAVFTSQTLFDRAQMDLQASNRAAFASAVIAALRVLRQTNRRQQAAPSVIHPGGPNYAYRLAEKLWHGSDQQFEELFRINKHTFERLVKWLEVNAGLEDSRYQSAKQKVMIFLWILAHAETQRNTAHKFQVSQSTVHEVVKRLLPMFVKLHTAYVTLPADDWLDEAIELPGRYRYFNGCIGAIDGTHIAAHVPARDVKRYFGRKGLTQNVFAAVRYGDYSFSYVLAGGEGTMNDAVLLTRACAGSFRIPRDRYYLADSGFGTHLGVVVPFANVRYHLQEWHASGRRPTNAKELYNLRHSSVRVCVKQAFGQVKRRWKILRVAAPEYDLGVQTDLVYAVTGLYNFVIRTSQEVAEQQELNTTEAAKRRAINEVIAKRRIRARAVVGRRLGVNVRKTTAVMMWRDWNA